MEIVLKPRCTPGASVNRTENGWRLTLLAGGRGTYRLAQLDDYAALSRRHFQHAPPWSLSLRARVSTSNLPGTWGFGLWNDPFGFSLGFGGTAGRLPVLPNAAWFFHASPPNWLSLSDGIPACGFFAGTIRSPHISSLPFTPGLIVLPFMALKPISRLMRRLAGKIVQQKARVVSVDVTRWHEYSIQWLHENVEFKIDGEPILQTELTPAPPLGLVLWIDNQFAAWTPEGRIGYGTLDNPEACLEIESSTDDYSVGGKLGEKCN
jgi:hypothetical protein